ILEQTQLKTDSNGQLDFILHLPKKGGTVSLSTMAGYSNDTKVDFEVAPAADFIASSSEYLVSGVSAAAALKTQNLTLKGTVGDAWSVEFDDSHFPNQSPLYLYRFYDLKNDDARQYIASYTAVRSEQGPEYGLNSVVFRDHTPVEPPPDGEPLPPIPDDLWQLNYQQGLAATLPGVSFWLKVEKDGKIFDTSNNKLKLTVEGGALSLTLKTAGDVIELTKSGIAQGQWHKVAFGLQADAAYLTLDDLPY
ncbi:MAG: hypothetical protein MJK04_02830, partial [Psychrosphaera sp.]|nr:hypothetical protein [Psychrosphaera sp.]